MFPTASPRTSPHDDMYLAMLIRKLVVCVDCCGAGG